MRVALGLAVAAAVLIAAGLPPELAAQPAAKEAPAAASKDTPAADRTRTKLLKTKVTVNFANVPLREVMKELAGQVEMMQERPVLWTYSVDVKPDTPVKFACNDKPLDAALDQLFKELGLGYFVVSKDDDKHDGWVKITKGTERGYDTAAPTTGVNDDDEEKKAASRLDIAKEFIEKGKPADAKAVLMLVVNKFPKTKAAAEAKQLLEKLNK